jgi:hypothetical protein
VDRVPLSISPEQLQLQLAPEARGSCVCNDAVVNKMAAAAGLYMQPVASMEAGNHSWNGATGWYLHCCEATQPDLHGTRLYITVVPLKPSLDVLCFRVFELLPDPTGCGPGSSAKGGSKQPCPCSWLVSHHTAATLYGSGQLPCS